MSISFALVIIYDMLILSGFCTPSFTHSVLSLPSCHRLSFMQSGSFCEGPGLCGSSRLQHIARSGNGKQWPVPTTAIGSSGRLSASGGIVPEGSDQSEWPLPSQELFPSQTSFDIVAALSALECSSRGSC